MSSENPFVYLDVSIDGEPVEKMIFEAGDLLRLDGNYGQSIYGDKFPDESPKLKHDEPGILTMAVKDRDTRGSLFSITFKANHDLDRSYIAFGKLYEGNDVPGKIERCGGKDGRPTVRVKIIKCGECQNENHSSHKRNVNILKNGEDASSEANTLGKMKHKKSSKSRRNRRKYRASDSDSSLDSETETREFDIEADSETSSSDSSSSSDGRRRKRKRSSKRDCYERAEKGDGKRDERHKRRDKISKHRSKRDLAGSSGSESKHESSTNDDSGEICRRDQKLKNPGHTNDISLHQKYADTPDMLEREEGEFRKENGQGQSNRIERETRSGKSADSPDVGDYHPGKSRSRITSPRRAMSRSLSIGPKRDLSKAVSPKRSISRSARVGEQCRYQGLMTA